MPCPSKEFLPLFSWDDIPGNDNDRLIGFLKKKFDIDWAKNANIEKIDEGKTIRLFFESNFLSLKLNDNKTNVSLKIDDDRTYEFSAKKENGKLNIYEFLSELGVVISDYLAIHPFTAGVKFEPRNKAELVAAVASLTQGAGSLRPLGSNYSLSSAAIADDVVDTSCLKMHLSQPYPIGTSPLDLSRLRDGGSDFLAKVCANDIRATGRHFVHIEAGVKIKDLLEDLGMCGLALPTMGAGGGQSIAGALSTGTHGADFKVPPLVDWIRAVHLVGPGGQEWWITQETSIFADERVLTLPDWCDDARIVANDDAFDAVRVAVGRMGVIYSMILEVVPAYSLIEVNLEHRWSEIREQLATSGVTAGRLTGVFDVSLRDLDSGWFRRQVLERSIIRADSPLKYEPGPSKWTDLSYFDSHPQEYVDLLSRLDSPRTTHGAVGIVGLAADLRGGETMPLHHINIVVSLSTPDRCWITRRWRRQGPVRPVGLVPDDPDEVMKAVKKNKRNPPGIVGPLQDKISSSVLPEELWFGRLFLVAKLKRLDWFLGNEIPRIAMDSAANGATSGEALFLIMYKLATDPVLDVKADIADTVSNAIGDAFSKLVRAGPASGGLHQNVLDVHDYDLDGGQSGNSAEFFFDASSGEYLGFLDAVVALAYAHSPVFGYMGIRFTPSATPLIAMQQFPLTVSVEVSTVRARQEDVYASFWNDLHTAANKYNGIPHWGQEFRQSEAEIATHFGERLVRWRRMLAELSIDSPSTFSTSFSRDTGLEPTEATGIFDSDAVEQFLVALEGSSD